MSFETLIRSIEDSSRSLPAKTTIVDFVADLWRRHDSVQVGQPLRHSLLDAVILAASGTDKPWLGGAAALQGAVHHLLADLPHSLERNSGTLVSFCASEQGGNHPQSIETRLEPGDSSAYEVTGSKRWATLSPLASHLLVVVSEGRDEQRNHLRAVLLPADRTGVDVEEMTIPGGVESNLRLPHGLIHFDAVRVFEAEVLPGDGYLSYLKPFRTVEDLYVCCARTASLLALGFRHEATADELEELVALLAALRAVAAEEVSAASSHLVVGAAETMIPKLAKPIIQRVPPETAAWWSSDGEVKVAASAKLARKENALRNILEGAS